MRTIDEMEYSAEVQRDGRFVGRVWEFPRLKTRPFRSRIDALDAIVALTAQELRERHERMGHS